MEPSQQRTVRTMCPMNCHPTLCGMLVDIEGDRLVGVRGDKENPDSRGFLCVRGQASQEIIGNPKRLLYPLVRERRTDDAWRQVSWDEAFELIASRMQTVGREAVGIWSGHGTASTNYGTRIYGYLLRRFANCYGCQWWNPTMICWGLGAFGLGVTGVLTPPQPIVVDYAAEPCAGSRELRLHQFDIYARHFVQHSAIDHKWWQNGERGHSGQSRVKSIGHAGRELNAPLWCMIGFHVYHDGCVGHTFLLQLAAANG